MIFIDHFPIDFIIIFLMTTPLLLLLLVIGAFGQNQSNKMLIRIQDAEDDDYEMDSVVVHNSVYIDITGSNLGAFRFPLYLDSNSVYQSIRLLINYNWGNGPASFFIYADDSVNSPPINYELKGISNRKRISTRVLWTINTTSASYGTPFMSPDLTPLILQVINKVGWQSGNYITLIFENRITNKNFEAISYEGSRQLAARLLLVGTKFPENAPFYFFYTEANGAGEPEPLVNLPINLLPLAPLVQCPYYTLFNFKDSTQDRPSSPLAPVVLSLDDLQVDYLEQVAVNVVQTTIQLGVDLLLNVIPFGINQSKILLPKLQEWYRDRQCQIEIGQHGLTHKGIQYSMDTLNFQQQKAIIEGGKKQLKSVGIEVREFTPPGGKENDVTLLVMDSLQFHSNIDWLDQIRSAHNISVIQTEHLCDEQKGAELGFDCVFHQPNELVRILDNSIAKNGYGSLAFHMQDFSTSSLGLNTTKILQYTDIINTLKSTGRYNFITPEEFYHWEQNK